MLTVDTYLDISNGKGIGLFSKNLIPKDSVWWIRKENFDKHFTPEELFLFDDLTVSFIKTYGFQEKTGNWFLCIDNARFSNHSDNPNTSNNFDVNQELVMCRAIRDILPGEEILCNYRDFCEASKINLGFQDQ